MGEGALGPQGPVLIPYHVERGKGGKILSQDHSGPELLFGSLYIRAHHYVTSDRHWHRRRFMVHVVGYSRTWYPADLGRGPKPPGTPRRIRLRMPRWNQILADRHCQGRKRIAHRVVSPICKASGPGYSCRQSSGINLGRQRLGGGHRSEQGFLCRVGKSLRHCDSV